MDQTIFFPDGGVVETACNAWSYCKSPDGCDGGNIPLGTCSLKFQFGVVNLSQMIFGITLDILLTVTTEYDSGYIDKSEPIGPPMCNGMTDLHYQVKSWTRCAHADVYSYFFFFLKLAIGEVSGAGHQPSRRTCGGYSGYSRRVLRCLFSTSNMQHVAAM